MCTARLRPIREKEVVFLTRRVLIQLISADCVENVFILIQAVVGLSYVC